MVEKVGKKDEKKGGKKDVEAVKAQVREEINQF